MYKDNSYLINDSMTMQLYTLSLHDALPIFMLVVAAGLMIRSFWALSHVNTGFRPDHIVSARITPDESFCDNTQRCLADRKSTRLNSSHMSISYAVFFL